MPLARRSRGTRPELHQRLDRLDALRGDGEHLARPDRHGAGLPRARVDRGRATLLPLRHGRAHPRLLRVPVGALRGAPGSCTTACSSRSITIPGTPTRSRRCSRRAGTGSTTSRGSSRPTSSASTASSSSRDTSCFAQAFPNTIPFSEGIGFIQRLEDGDDAIDWTYFVTAHELAHQWWAHQSPGGFAQGATILYRRARGVLGARADGAEVRPRGGAEVPAPGTRRVPARPGPRAEEGGAVPVRREPAVHPLPEGRRSSTTRCATTSARRRSTARCARTSRSGPSRARRTPPRATCSPRSAPSRRIRCSRC